MKNKSLDEQDRINLRICHNFLEGEGLPDEIRKQERYFELRKTEQKAEKFCEEFEEMFSKPLMYKTKGKKAFFKYDVVSIAIRKFGQGCYASKRNDEW